MSSQTGVRRSAFVERPALFSFLTALSLLATGLLVLAGERAADDIRLDSESLNACGASFSADAGIELGWTIGQHGLHGGCTDCDGGQLGLQNGIWTESEARFAGTVFMFR